MKSCAAFLAAPTHIRLHGTPPVPGPSLLALIANRYSACILNGLSLGVAQCPGSGGLQQALKRGAFHMAPRAVCPRLVWLHPVEIDVSGRVRDIDLSGIRHGCRFSAALDWRLAYGLVDCVPIGVASGTDHTSHRGAIGQRNLRACGRLNGLRLLERNFQSAAKLRGS